ncbi:MAG: glycosyltransferase [Anaerolineae bacterium]|nr:glycosyltransferase [Anaerolineae bacterium]
MVNQELVVSVGLPIYNAGELTRTILESLISQEYSNIEIIISDNASEDQTWSICQEYAARDNRIRLFQNSENMEAIYNFHRVYELSTGKYFMWAAHDDYWDVKFIQKCVDKLEANPEAVMVYTDQTHINETTQEKKIVHFSALNLTQHDRPQRIKSLLTFRPQLHAIIYGMYRREIIKPFLPFALIPSADLFFLFRVMLEGVAVSIPEVLYERHVKPPLDFRTRMKTVRPNENLPPNFVIVLQTFFVHLDVIRNLSETLWGKMKISLSATRYVFSTYGVHFFPRPLQPILRSIKRSLVG